MPGSSQGVTVAPISPDWVLLESAVGTQLSDDYRLRITRALSDYAEWRAVEEYAPTWSGGDDALLKRADRLSKVAKQLLQEFRQDSPATGYFIGCVERINDEFMYGRGKRFSREAFDHLLEAFVEGADVVRQRLVTDKKISRGTRPPWGGFVKIMAELYWQIVGEKPTAAEVHGGNRYESSKQSRFAEFAFAAMMQVPPELREKGASRQNIEGFSRALREPLREWESRYPLRGFKKRKI
ncbi:hypothetical protein [Methylocystis parvus]|uniref:hypothetical protein n=1 Tax=Methylocystis parvus TaxID=134 RepID=UPI003C717A98